MEIRVDWSEKRQRHILDRMILRGISRQEFLAALRLGAKRRQKEGIYESSYRYFSVVYEERHDAKRRRRKVYPITVKVGP